MPDWFYRTISRPVLFRLPATVGRDIALCFIGTLARMPLGPALIDFLGHMRPDPHLRRSHLGISFGSAVGLAPGIDAEALAVRALAQFGFGFLEIGPVTVEPQPAFPSVERRIAQQALWYPDPPGTIGLADLTFKLKQAGPSPVPLIVRLGYFASVRADKAAAAAGQVVAALAPHSAAFSLAIPPPVLKGEWRIEDWQAYSGDVAQTVAKACCARRLFLCVPAGLDDALLDRLLGPAPELSFGGIIIVGTVRAADGGWLTGSPAREPALRLARRLRQRCGDRLVIIGSGGVHEPEDALLLRKAGADLVEIDSGLVYSGPGLPKRINDALLFAGSPAPRGSEAARSRPAEMAWFWSLLMGAGMLIGSVLALVIAATRVVLPYDEWFVGMTRADLMAVNDRLLAFLAHDRVSLAGTMLAVGVLYVGLSLFGIRRGLHWARQAVLASAFTGFGTFFLFLGFGYFDPFHAFVTASLFQFLLLALHAKLGPPAESASPDLREDWRWRWAQWGQLLFVIQGCGLIAAGLAIGTIGVTCVFVPEDLEFMHTAAETLASANARLVPLIAHDRATFGGMLLAAGLTVLLSSLWGFRRGARWLWWTWLASGPPAYAAAIGVHLTVGYLNMRHLAPPFLGTVLFLLALGLSYPFLCQPGPPAAPSAQEDTRSHRQAATE